MPSLQGGVKSGVKSGVVTTDHEIIEEPGNYNGTFMIMKQGKEMKSIKKFSCQRPDTTDMEVEKMGRKENQKPERK
jgi:pimeloyl-CoA synthetase